MHEKDSFAGVFWPENSGGISKQEEFLKECLRNCYCRNSLRNVAGKPFVALSAKMERVAWRPSDARSR